jgi:hypothetical protein
MKGAAMSRRYSILIVGSLAVAAFVSHAGIARTTTKDPSWVAKDWTKWTTQDCIEVLNWSPWVHVERSGSGFADPNVTLNIQFRSALPIREAFLRQTQLENRYDKMNAKKKQAFDQQHAADLAGDDNVLVYISNISHWTAMSSFDNDNAPYADRPANPPREFALKLSDGILVMPTKITVLKDGEFENECLYIFPRTVNGKPVFTASDSVLESGFGGPLDIDNKTKEAELQSFSHVYPAFTFKISDLMYKGKLEY